MGSFIGNLIKSISIAALALLGLAFFIVAMYASFYVLIAGGAILLAVFFFNCFEEESAIKKANEEAKTRYPPSNRS